MAPNYLFLTLPNNNFFYFLGGLDKTVMENSRPVDNQGGL